MTDLTKLEIWIDEDHKTTAAELLADNEGHADVADAVARLASNKDHTIAIGIGAGWTTLSVLPPLSEVHHSLIDAVTRIQSATSDLHELWAESGSDASDIMHDSAVNHWYPFKDELGQIVADMENWRAVLAREKDCCPCDHCAEVVMSDETHGEGGEWLCGDCYGILSKSCAECKRTMTADECGDELPEERVCDTCAGIEADAPIHWACLDLGGNMVAELPDGRLAVFSEEPLIGDGPCLFLYAADDRDMEKPPIVIPCPSIGEAQGALDRAAKVAPEEPTHDTDSCEDAGCSDHGIDAMPDRWAEDAGTQ